MKCFYKYTIGVVILLGTLVLLSCNLPTQSSEPTANITTLTILDGEYGGIAWFEEFIIIESLTNNGERNLYSSRLWKMNLNGTDFQILNFPDNPVCGPDGKNGFENPMRLPDGRLGFSIICRSKIGANQLVSMAYDFKTEALEQFPKYEMPYYFFGIEASWNPRMKEGIAFADNRLNSWVYKLTLEKWELLDLRFPQIRGMEWSPNGSRIAFIAAPEQGLSGMSRIDAKFDIYIMNSDGNNIQMLFTNIYDPYSLLWSKNGNYLIFNGTIRRTQGVWSLNIDSKEAQLIHRGYIVFGGLSSDGNKLLGIHKVSDTEKSEIVVLDLSEIIKK